MSGSITGKCQLIQSPEARAWQAAQAATSGGTAQGAFAMKERGGPVAQWQHCWNENEKRFSASSLEPWVNNPLLTICMVFGMLETVRRIPLWIGLPVQSCLLNTEDLQAHRAMSICRDLSQTYPSLRRQVDRFMESLPTLPTPKTCIAWHNLAHDLHVIPWFNQVGQISEGLPRLPTSAPWYFPEQRSKNCQNFQIFCMKKHAPKAMGTDCSPLNWEFKDVQTQWSAVGTCSISRSKRFPISSIVPPVWCARLTMAEMTLQGLQICEMWPWLQPNSETWEKGLKGLTDLKVGKGNLLVHVCNSQEC